jgi:catechol 2,3-dioxygenase-like lactoylglutathione lyase family enzyme
LIHGQILGGVVTTPDVDAALADYHGQLGLKLVERGNLDASLAASWGCLGSAGASMAVLQPESGAPCFIRLVEQPLHPDFVPTTTFGWASYELTVKNVFGWPARLEGSGFEIIGPPKEIPGLPYFVAMQMLGRGREMIYLNEVRQNSPSSDLPKAHSQIDHIFIVILASPDREATVAWYRKRLGLDAGETYTIEYSMINNAFGLPATTTSSLTMVQQGRMPIVEVDDYPPQATSRPVAAGCLPQGNALVTLAVNDLDRLEVSFIASPDVRHGVLYGGQRAATVIGPAGELLELVEMA